MPEQSRRRPRRLRVAFVCGQLEIGGQETGMLELLRRLDRTQFTPFVYTFYGGPLLPVVRRMGIPTLIGNRRSALGRWTDADSKAKSSFRRRLAARMRADRIDVCLVYAWADALPAAREAGTTAIVERVDGPKLIGWVRDKSSCQRIICESGSIARLIRAQGEWLRCASVPIAVIRNGVDRTRFNPADYTRSRSRRALGLEPDDFVVGTVARLAPVKNLSHLLDAARLLLDKVNPAPRIRFVIAGPDGGTGAALRKQARTLGIASHVRFLGARSDVPRVLSALDVFALTSIQEGMPFALLEAMAMGLPVVAAQADSIAESVQDNAFLVGPLDPFRTTLALRDLLFNEGLRREMGRRSLQRAARYDVNDMVRGYERALRAAFREGQRRQRFRRRIAVVPGHSAGPGATHRHAIDLLGKGLLASQVDAYEFVVGPADRTRTLSWPPRRRESFSGDSAGRLARKTALEWIQPDVIVTDCPRVVESARTSFPGEEILFVADPRDGCPGRLRALRSADRILVERVADGKEYQARWPELRAKLWTMPPDGRDRVRALCRLLADVPRQDEP